MMKFSYFNILLCSIFLTFSCSEKEKSLVTSIATIDLSNADGLFIGKVSVNGARLATSNSTDEERLFKITTDGIISEAEFKNKNGDVIKVGSAATSVINVNDAYIIIEFDIIGFLVRKSDGAVFSLEDVGIPQDLQSYKREFWGDCVASDNNGNIYYRGKGDLIKIDISNPEVPVKSSYSAVGDDIIYFVVDKEGNAIYFGTDITNNYISRYRKASGGFELLSNQATLFWTGLDEQLYFFDSSVEKITTNPFGISKYGTLIGGFGCSSMPLLKMKNANKIIAPGICSDILEVYNTEGQPRSISYGKFNLASIKSAAASDNYYYLGGTDVNGKGVLVKIDPLTDEFTNIVTEGYDFYKLTVSSDDQILFNALQLSDGRIVLGKITPNTPLEILDISLAQEVSVLKRMN